MNRNKSGFTLIELLVVIAIIAILAAILFPVFAQAREKARQASCISNVKQIALAVTMYTQDFDETYPIVQWWGDYNWATMKGGWAFAINPYIKNLGVWKCPSDGGGLANAPDSSGWCGVALGYPANAFHSGWNGSYAYAQGPINYVASSGATWLELGAVSVSKMSRPADTILTAEKHASESNGNYPGVFCSTGAPTGDVITGNMDDFGQWAPDGSRADGAYPRGKNGGVSAKHNEQATFSFCDGHAKSMKPVQTNPDPAHHWELNLWDGTRQ